MRKIRVKDFFIGSGQPLAVLCGPCVIESEEHTLKMAEALKKIFKNSFANLVFKASYDKANRTSLHSYRGPGLEKGLRILEKVQRECDLPVITDVHSSEEAAAAGEVCDLVQVPAFLCRQTDLIVAAARTGKVVNIKKGQFMAPWDMKNVVEKCRASGNPHVLLTDRGAAFGYNNLVSDMRAIPIMQGIGVPVCFDVTHSVQLPGGLGERSGGQREFIPVLAKAAIAAGADSLFIEAHDDPRKAKSDAASVLNLKELPGLLAIVEQIYQIVYK